MQNLPHRSNSAENYGFITHEEVANWPPLGVPVAEDLFVDYSWFGFHGHPIYGLSIGLIGLTDDVERISLSLLHEYTHLVVYRIEGEKAAAALDNRPVRMFLEESFRGYNGNYFDEETWHGKVPRRP